MLLSPSDRVAVSNAYSPRERESIYQVLCAIMKIAGHHTDEKWNFICEVMDAVGISKEDQKNSRKLNADQMNAALRSMSQIKKIYLAKFMSITSLIGEARERETKFVYGLFRIFEIPEDF